MINKTTKILTGLALTLLIGVMLAGCGKTKIPSVEEFVTSDYKISIADSLVGTSKETLKKAWGSPWSFKNTLGADVWKVTLDGEEKFILVTYDANDKVGVVWCSEILYGTIVTTDDDNIYMLAGTDNYTYDFGRLTVSPKRDIFAISMDVEEGDLCIFEFKGEFAETYPMQIGAPYGCAKMGRVTDEQLEELREGWIAYKADGNPAGSNAKIENSQKPAYKRMAMVRGIVYVDTGYVSGVTGRCGNLDGSFDDIISIYDMPEKDGQSNFQADGWQMGFEEDTIEIPTDEGWCIFAAYGSGKYSENYIPESVLQFIATVEEVKDDYIIVKADMGIEERFQGSIQENGRYQVSLENYSPGIYGDAALVPGNVVNVVCKGDVLETSPAILTYFYKVTPAGGDVCRVAQRGTIEGYEYEINDKNLFDVAGGYAQSFAKRGYMIDSENRPDAPNFYYIFSGEKPTGGYGIDVRNIAIDKEGNVSITAGETAPGQGETVTAAFTYPFCTVTIYPAPKSVKIVDMNGTEYEYLH